MTSHWHTTTDHDEIRRWIQAHHGTPARIAHPATTTHFLRIDFHDVDIPVVEHISLQEWFSVFDEQRLAFCYPDPHIRGGTSAWFELVQRDRCLKGN
ncbi:MAG: hypothetical protein WAW17_30725 [Rhodococcus sp. (in: high G+C Gram-positive bacteria)]|uniref:hypothetical protein n=1 Tax=Rhodococcus sp. TaxID=1831 RepID=UPI003BAFD0D0